MELYDKVKQQFNESLRASIIESMKQRDIRYDLNSTGEPYKYLTVFSISKDIKLPKNLRTKARLARPQLDVQYIRERNFDYATVSSPDFKKKNEHDLRPINFLWGELEDITEFADTKTRIIAWCRSIFSELSKTYKDEYGITLYLMPMEFYLPNYKGLCNKPAESQLIPLVCLQNYYITHLPIKMVNHLSSKIRFLIQCIP